VRRRLVAWLPALAWATLIFLLSSRPALPAPDLVGLDKLAHFAVYAVLGVLLSHAGLRTAVPSGWLIALGVLYGASDEWHQFFVPGRTPEFADWVADACGVVAGVLLHRRWRHAPAFGSR
jgi:VanZ family protein